MIGDEKYVMSGGLRLWTERFGDRDDPTVLLIMGTSAQAIGWPDELVARLVHSGRQVIRFDHRDTGRSDCVDFSANPYALADMAADTLAVLDGHGIDLAHVAGVSLGGAIGQWLAVRHGAGAPRDPRATHRRGPADLASAQRRRPPVRRASRTTVRRTLPPAGSRSRLGHQPRPRGPPVHRGTARATVLDHGTHPGDPRQRGPIFATAHAEALAAQVPGARLHIIEGMGHNLFSPGLPERIADLVVDHTATR